jgi:hypothetical protein
MTSNTVQAVAHTSGLPAKVEPWSPGFMASATDCGEDMRGREERKVTNSGY